jgi:hypothetical protein
MAYRLLGVCVTAVLALAILAAPAGAQVNINPGGPNAQLAQYVQPERGGGGNRPAQVVEAAGGSGQLPFTGLMILPLAMIGVGLVLGAAAVGRRARDARAA